MGENLEKIGNRGLIFTAEAIAGLAVLVLGISVIAVLAEPASGPTVSKEWLQTKAILDTQTRFLSNDAPSAYQGPGDYYCYQLHDLNIGTGTHPIRDFNNCEETP